MRSNAIIAAVVTAAAVVGIGGAKVFADAPAAGSNPAPNYVTVQQGDYLSAIAGSHNSTYVRIYDANQQIKDPNLIYPGEVLRIPDPGEQLVDRPLPQATPAAPAQTDTAATAALNAPAVSGSSIWYSLAACESGGNWAIDTGNGFYGGLQFTLSSWQAVGGSGYPNEASPSEQIMRAELLQARQGWGAWPVCSAKLGL